MSEIDPTPSTPVTLGDRMAWWRGDQAARLNDMAARLNAIQTELQALNTTISSGSGNIDAAPIVAALEAVQGVDAPHYESSLNTIRSLNQALGTLTNYVVSISQFGSHLTDIADRLDTIQSVLGAAPYASTETGNIRALLLSLVLNQHPFGIQPDADDRPTTDSVSTITTAGWRYAVWSSVLPSFAVSEQGMYIRPDVQWDGYQIYIKTDAPSVYMEDRTNPEQSIPEFWANTWWDLTGTDEWGWRVPSVYNIRAYLRGQNSTTEVLNSQYVTVMGENIQAVPWFENGTAIVPDWPNNTASAPIYLPGNYNGWRVRVISGSNVKLYLYRPSWLSVNISPDYYVITVNTTYIAFYGNKDIPFTVEFSPTPPSGSIT